MDETSTAARTPGTPRAMPPRPSRAWSRTLVGLAALVVAALAATHIIATFLYNAPGNVVSKRYSAQISWWISPLLIQNWQLFAPNPVSENVAVDARASVGGDAAVTPWLDLSAIDRTATAGNPVPSHLTMNALRNAWREYIATHSPNGPPTSPAAATSQQYLQNVVLGYLRPREPGPIDSIQVRFIITLIPGPGRSAAQLAPQTQTLSWWVVP